MKIFLSTASLMCFTAMVPVISQQATAEKKMTERQIVVLLSILLCMSLLFLVCAVKDWITELFMGKGILHKEGEWLFPAIVCTVVLCILFPLYSGNKADSNSAPFVYVGMLLVSVMYAYVLIFELFYYNRLLDILPLQIELETNIHIRSLLAIASGCILFDHRKHKSRRG